MGNESELMKYIENICLDTEESDLRTVNINNMGGVWCDSSLNRYPLVSGHSSWYLL
ncbi:protein of unknown function [Petrocella atlantisensis]|uniref:Uncharacterized protein n=1 Tax=Petrocella atlantisensis TaxID=2173034 RepID=A0A3P7S1I6_9FIRM|nr:protein of unknown function [Petrocella atlantisensis]